MQSLVDTCQLRSTCETAPRILAVYIPDDSITPAREKHVTPRHVQWCNGIHIGLPVYASSVFEAQTPYADLPVRACPVWVDADD